jgi:protein involved in ribonucleotide reduction
VYDVVYFSSVSENTKRLVEKLGLTAVRIPLKTEEAERFTYDRDSVLIVPTYGSGEEKTTVPKQVIKFLNNPENRKHIKGVVATGNTNFGSSYGLAGVIVSEKLGVPLIQRIEILGTPEDITQLKERLTKLWELR